MAGAFRALQRRVVELEHFAKPRRLAELLDGHFMRHVAPAFALAGDLVILAGDEAARGLQAVCITDGKRNLFGWHETHPEGLSVIKGLMATLRRLGCFSWAYPGK